MINGQKKSTVAAVIGTVAVILMAGMVTPAFARTISMKDGGPALWIFIIVGAAIVLLQLIPAIILFFSFIGTISTMVLRGKKAEEEVPEFSSGYEPATAKK